MSDSTFTHLFDLSTAIGTFEHADGTTPRVEHGYCSDDMARVLIAVSREPDPTADLVRLGHTAYRFLADGQSVSGRMRNRRDATGRWTDRPSTEDCWGRSLWAFGTAARRAPENWMRQSALASFEHGATQRSRWPHAMAFAALGAAEVLAEGAAGPRARDLLADAATVIGAPARDPEWPWPTGRLSYANAVLPDALIAAGVALGRRALVEDGLRMLRWLVQRETTDGHLSPTPVGGSGPGDRPPRFDQQPIEVATLADACARAATVDGDGDGFWLGTIERAGAWFDGDNDMSTPMVDPASGGGFDGLTPSGANQNCGAESTLAMISTRQLVARIAFVGR